MVHDRKVAAFMPLYKSYAYQFIMIFLLLN